MTLETKGMWIVGYGSLIYKAPIHYQYRVPGVIHGFIRRFWQSSSDHRGTPESPGRVSTIISYKDIVEHPDLLENTKKHLNLPQDHVLKPNDLCIIATAYYIPPEKVQEVTEYLDEREQDGYTTHKINVHLIPPSADSQNTGMTKVLDETLPKTIDPDNKLSYYALESTVYIGTLDNESYVGMENVKTTAQIIAKNVGPSGTNYEYLKRLFDSIEDILTDCKGKYLIQQRDWYLTLLMQEVDALRPTSFRE